MNHIIRSRLMYLVVFFLVPMGFAGCGGSWEECLQNPIWMDLCYPLLDGICVYYGYMWCSMLYAPETSQDRTEDTGECTEAIQYYLSAVILTCEAYPDQCCAFFDSWVQSFDADVEK